MRKIEQQRENGTCSARMVHSPRHAGLHRVVRCATKPNLHQQQRRSNIVECYKSNDAFDKVERCFDIVAVFSSNIERIFSEISSFRQNRNKLNMFNLFPFCRKDEISFDIVSKNGNNVELIFDLVDRNVPLAAFDNVSSTLLLV